MTFYLKAFLKTDRISLSLEHTQGPLDIWIDSLDVI